VGIHLRDQRHQHRRRPDHTHRAGRHVEEIATCRLGRRHRCHGSKSPSCSDGPPADPPCSPNSVAPEAPSAAANHPAALRPENGRPSGTIQRAFIGTPDRGVQGRRHRKGQGSDKSWVGRGFGARPYGPIGPCNVPRAGWAAGHDRRFMGLRGGCSSSARAPQAGEAGQIWWLANCANVPGINDAPLDGGRFRGTSFLAASRFPACTAMRLALYEPDIPQNAGTILRLCACLGVEAHLIEPAGFPTTDRAFRRAGMDYLDQVALVRHASWEAFETWRRGDSGRLLLFTTRARRSYLDHAFRADDVLMFGRESAGVPERVHEAATARLRIPMRPGLRSLNVAV